RATNLAVALADTAGRLIGEYINRRPTWSLLYSKTPPISSHSLGEFGCPFSLAPLQICNCVADALARGGVVVARDRTGLVHFAVPLVLGEHPLGALVAGQVFDQYPEQLPLEQVAKQLGLSPAPVWQIARLEHPIKRATLDVYADLLATLGQTFLTTRYHTILAAERRGQERMAEAKAEARLKNANANLEQKNREMAEFAHTVSHDLKSPLVTIGGVLGLLKEELQEERLVAAGELIATAEETVVGMRDTIDDLLKLSRIGTVAIDLQPVELRQVAEELIRKHAPELEDKHTAVSLELSEDQPTVLADRNRLVEVMDNLIVNALKYACDGPEPRITIGSETVGSEVRLFVKDNGPGIGKEHHEKIFGLFQRLGESKEGTGVGLAIVKRIMEVHGGRVWVESAIGEGATFWLAFPAAVGEAAMSLSAQGCRGSV
ncbi:MAG: ATP-binding protein, partial [Pirellulales bacterium]